MYNYLGIVNKSSAVNKCISCSFLSPFPNINLIISKGNIIEIYNITKEGLEITPYIKVYGNIILLEKINYFQSNTADDLFLMTDDLDFSIISFDKNKNEIICTANGNIKGDLGKIQDKIYYAFDNDFKYLIISAYKNIFKIIHLQQRDKNPDFTIRSDYEDLLFLFPIFIESTPDDRERSMNILNFNNSNTGANANISNNPIAKFNVLKKSEQQINNNNINVSNPFVVQNKNNIAIGAKTAASPGSASTMPTTFGAVKVNSINALSDHKQLIVETFSLDIKNKQFIKDCFINCNNNISNFNTVNSPTNEWLMDLTNSPAISYIFSPRIGGLCIFYANCLKYYEFIGNKIIEKESKNYSERKFVALCEVDKTRYLVSDDSGNLFILGFKKREINNFNFNNPNNSDSRFNIVFQFLGEINIPSSIAFLDSNYIFIGSEKANSQLIKTLRSPRKHKNRPLIDIIEEYDNLAPISDFLVLNKNKEENYSTEILCVSGSHKSCCLKSIRKGTSFSADAEIFIPFIKSFNSVLYYNSDHSLNLNNKNNKDGERENRYSKVATNPNIKSNYLTNSNNESEYCDDDFNHGNNNENVLLFLRYKKEYFF